MGLCLCYTQSISKSHAKHSERGITMYEMKWVRDHIEVYRGGEFCFSADSRAEAERELEEEQSA